MLTIKYSLSQSGLTMWVEGEIVALTVTKIIKFSCRCCGVISDIRNQLFNSLGFL